MKMLIPSMSEAHLQRLRHSAPALEFLVARDHQEALPAGHPLWSRPEVIITPHASGHSPHADARMFDLLCENTRRFAQGEPLLNVVDLEMEY